MRNPKSQNNSPDLSKMDPRLLLVGYISEFNNRVQTVGDTVSEDVCARLRDNLDNEDKKSEVSVSWKQMFILNCISMFKKSPTIVELGDFIGTSHQNTKQLLIKLERIGYVEFVRDEIDMRKTRVNITEKGTYYLKCSKKINNNFMTKLFDGVSKTDMEAAARMFMILDENIGQMLD